MALELDPFPLHEPHTRALMNRLVVSLCSFLLASAGWWMGAQVGGIFTAFTVSMIGTGFGIYAGKRLVNMWDL